MSYKVDNEDLQSLLAAYSSAISTWSDEIASVKSTAAAIEESTNIAGNNADRMREYLQEVYTLAGTSLSALLTLFYQNFLLYTEAYRNLDNAEDAHIEEAELSDRHKELQAKERQLREIDANAASTISSIRDIAPVSLPSFDDADKDFELILSSIKTLDEDITALENTHKSGDFTEIDALIAKLTAYFKDLLGQKKEYKTAFTAAGFTALASVPALKSTLEGACSQIVAQKSAGKVAAENLKKRLEAEQAEISKREEQAKWAKVGFNIVVSGVSTVATIALSSVIGPAAKIVVDAASGGLKSAFSEAADQYAENGWDMQDWDVSKIASQGCIGTLTGMVGGCTAEAGNCVKTSVSVLSSVFETGASASYDQLAASGYITDAGEIAEDSLIKGGGSFVGSVLSDAASDWLGNRVANELGVNYLTEGGVRHVGAVAQEEIASELGSGIVERFSSSVIEETGEVISAVVHGKSLEEAYSEHDVVGESIKSAFDASKMVEDVGTAVTSEAVIKEAIEDPWDNWSSEEYDRLTEKLAEMDARGEDAENYEIFGDPRTIETQRQAAVKEGWEKERQLVLQGKGTRDWSVSQQEELIQTGKVSGFEGQHMVSVSSDSSLAGNSDNIQFLTYEEHLYGAHGGNFQNATSGRYDPETGEMDVIESTEFPTHRNLAAKELSQKFDYTQADVAEQLGSDFGYGRGKKSE